MNNQSTAGELVFRLCGVGITGLLYIAVQVVLFIVVYVVSFMILPNRIGLEVIDNFEVWMAVLGLTVNFIGWLLIFVIPLVRNGQTIGMRYFGLQVVKSPQVQNERKALLVREVALLLLAVSVVGLLLACVIALFDSKERTVWDCISGTRVIQVPAKFQFVDEVRDRVLAQANQ